MLSESELNEIEARAGSAHDEIRRLCVGEGRVYDGEHGRVVGRRFTMSIPVRPDDSDVLLHAPIQDTRALVREVRRLRAVADASGRAADEMRSIATDALTYCESDRDAAVYREILAAATPERL